MAPRLLVVFLIALVLAPTALAQAAPQNLHAFLLRATEPEDPTHTYPRTPSFAWDPVRGAVAYEFEVATSRTFAENAMVWETDQLKTPVAAIPLTLPWTTGAPNSLYARVRALLPGDEATAWSARYGFRLRAPGAPASLSTGPNPVPGMIRWTPVEGATAYEVSFLYDLAAGKVKKIKTATTAADLREFYSFHNNLAALEIDDVYWRVRAVREVEGKALNNLPIVSYGPWSSEFTTYEPPLGVGQVQPAAALSRSRASDIVSTASAVGEPHELVPGFAWSGRLGLNGAGNCPSNVSALGVTCPLYHVYVYTDEDCVNRVHTSDVIGSPAYVPRLSRPLALPGDTTTLGQAGNVYLDDAEDEGAVFDAGGEKVFAAGTHPSVPADPEDEDLPEGTLPDRKSGLWDNDWPDSRYYWTVVPAIPYITPDGSVEYRDVEFSEAMCTAGRMGVFGKTSAPVVERANGVPFVSGLTSTGEVRGATSDRPSFFGRALVAWKPAPGATKYHVQWSRKAAPFRALGSVITPSTAALLNLPDGVWHYRVRGIDKTLPTLRRGMTWSDPQYLKIAPRVFVRVRR
jgi:hypothetical protein